MTNAPPAVFWWGLSMLNAAELEVGTLTSGQTSTNTLEAKWGIQIASLRLSAQGNLVDFRYKVLDPAKAAVLGNPKSGFCLIDQASGAKLYVPNAPKLGPLRQTSSRLKPGKIYFVLFANPRHTVVSGSKVTVQIGGFQAENLTVE